MRILLLSWSYLPNKGGLETCIFNISKRLKKKKYKIIIVTKRCSKIIKKIERINGIFVFRIYPIMSWSSIYMKKNPFRIITEIIVSLPVVFSLARIIRSFKIDVINLHYLSPAAIYVFSIAKLLKIKVVTSLHGEFTQAVNFGGKFEKWFFRTLLKQADIITACSQDLLKNSFSLCPNTKRITKVIGNGVDLQEFNINSESNTNLRKKYIFSMGIFDKRKGFDLLISAFSYLIEKKYDINLVISGCGYEEKSLKELAKLLRIEDRVIFYGFSEGKKKINLLNGCEFFVLASRIEPFGIVNLEAMAAGKAVVATKVGGVEEIVKNGINGILVEPYNVKALAEGMASLLDNVELKERLGRNARKIVQDMKFSWETITEEYIDSYKKALSLYGNEKFN